MLCSQPNAILAHGLYESLWNTFVANGFSGRPPRLCQRETQHSEALLYRSESHGLFQILSSSHFSALWLRDFDDFHIGRSRYFISIGPHGGEMLFKGFAD